MISETPRATDNGAFAEKCNVSQPDTSLETLPTSQDPSCCSGPPASPIKKSLRGAINQLLEVTSSDVESFAQLRDLCEEAQGQRRMQRKSRSNTATAPKSPQERLLAFMPLSSDKSKNKAQRRSSPSHSSSKGSDIVQTFMPDDDEAPIADLTVMFMGDVVPDGFDKIEKSPSGLRADLNKGGRGHFVFLAQSREKSLMKPPISEILVIFPERGDFVPSDYEVVNRKGAPANLNTGTQGEKIYLCYKRSPINFIVDIIVVFPKKGEKLPYGYIRVEKSPNGHLADVNASSGGTEVWICYKKKLNGLSPLQNRFRQMPRDERSESSPQRRLSLEGSTAGLLDGLGSGKTTELRAQNPVLAVDLQSASCPSSSTLIKPEVAPMSVEDYLYVLLVACYTRHGNVAEKAVESLTDILNSGLRSDVLEMTVEAVVSVCYQGVRSRFPAVLLLLRKIITISPNGFSPFLLHSMLKCLTFMGEYDATLVKSVADELIVRIMTRFEGERCETSAKVTKASTAPAEVFTHALGSNETVSSIVATLIDDVTSGVEIAKTTENVLAVFKSHTSIHAHRFWIDLSIALRDYRPSVVEQNAYHLIISLSKCLNRKIVCSWSSSSADNLLIMNREHAGFVNCIRALNVALLSAGPTSKESRVFGQLIRRFVFSAVNSLALLWAPKVFRASLMLISTLWNHYRRHVKVELALLFEHLFLRVLRHNCVGAATYQLDIMNEITPWLQLPHNVVEMFLNFDLDRQFVQQWKIFEHLCAALCSIAEGTTNGVHGAYAAGSEDVEKSTQQLQTQAMSTILAVARSIMDASGHAHLISRDARTRLLSMERGGWEQDDEQQQPGILAAPLPLPVADANSPTSSTSAVPTLPGASSTGGVRTSGKYGTLSVRMRNELQKRNQQYLKRAMEISSTKSLKKAIEFLIAMNFVKDSPRDITSFIRIYHDFFDEIGIGDYLGEGDEDFKVQVRLTYVRAISFTGMSLVESLRHFLTNGGFRLPGEAQKIERMVEAFAQCYYEDSPTSFSSADTVMIIAYSIIMLNTDLHNPQVKKDKMSKEQFVKNNRGIDGGKDLPRRVLEDIYDSILHHPMQLRPQLRKENSSGAMDAVDNEKFRNGLAKSIAQSEELMKDLSRSYYSFNFVGVDASISPDLIKILFERVWFYFLALSTSILNDNQSDLSMTMQGLDLLRFSISTCLFLGMHQERQAFANLLRKLEQSFEANVVVNGVSVTTTTATATHQVEWIKAIDSAVAADDPWCVMGDLHLLVSKLKDTIQRRQTFEIMKSVLKRINRGAFYLKDTTQFIKEGDLTKRCRSRNQSYRFFLFNDQLLYCDKSMTGNWTPHNSLRLKVTRVADVPDTILVKNAFQILNPVKSFVVYAENASVKAEWMHVIEEAIAEASLKRNARRFSFRMQPQAIDQATPHVKPLPPPVLAPSLSRLSAVDPGAASSSTTESPRKTMVDMTGPQSVPTMSSTPDGSSSQQDLSCQTPSNSGNAEDSVSALLALAIQTPLPSNGDE